MKEEFEGVPFIDLNSREHHAHIRQANGRIADINYILRNRYLDKTIRVTIEEVEVTK